MTKKTSILKALFKLHLITPRGLFRLAGCFIKEGVTLMAVLRFASRYYPDCCAIVSEGERLTYKQLYDYALQVTDVLYSEYHFRPHDHVGILCRNHSASVALFTALSRLGVNIRLLNSDMGSEKMESFLQKWHLNAIVYDEELQQRCLPADMPCESITIESVCEKVQRGVVGGVERPRITRGGQISVFTGGSSGKYKEASRKTGVLQFLPPFIALLKDICIQNYQSVYLSLPFYHGFGLGTLVISMAMGKKICLARRFKEESALEMIEKEQVEVMPTVPAMLARIWQTEGSEEKMKSVKCVISGGDRLSKKLLDTTREKLGDVLFNLYGTSEAGFFMMATPQDLSSKEEVTLGRPITGVECEVRDKDGNGVGTLWVRSKWAMIGQQNKWQSTGDRVRCDEEGYFFHESAGKMVVCGGENVYPENVEQVIAQYPEVVNTKVYPVADETFGFVLKAQVELAKDSHLTTDELKAWLKPKLARAEMPHEIVFQKIEILSTGKRGVG